MTAQPLRALVSAGFCGALAGPAGGRPVAPDEVRDEASGELRARPGDARRRAGRARHAGAAVRLARTPADRARLDGLATTWESAPARASWAAGILFLAPGR